MTIALDATYSVGRDLSGVGIYSRELIRGLAAEHPEERFLCYYRPHRFFKAWRDSVPAAVERRLLWGTPARADLFHALNQRVDGKGKRVVSTFHDLFVMTGDYSTPEFRRRFTEQAREAARYSDWIIAVSEFTAGQVSDLLGFDRRRIRVVPHGVYRPESVPADEHRENLILFVGALQRRKNVARLIEAFAAMPQGWRLVLAGAMGYQAEEVVQAVQSSPRGGDIEITGYLPAAQLADLLKRARIFAFPSLDEGFGIPVLEAMANGIPVLTSRRSALPEVAGDAALLVDPDSAEEIAHGLLALAQDPELRRNLSAKGRDRSLLFPWRRTVAETWNVYEQLLGKA